MVNENHYAKIRSEVIHAVKDACATEDRWRYHIYPVVEYGKLLSEKLGADEEVVELACWLHDLTRIKGDVQNHHITSSLEAEVILEKLSYDKEKIKKVSRCIYAHRGSFPVEKNNIEEEIVACADAMAHLDFRVILFYSAFGKKQLSLEDGIKWINDKIDRSWNKLTIPFAKEMMKEKYLEIKSILNFMDESEFSKFVKNVKIK